MMRSFLVGREGKVPAHYPGSVSPCSKYLES